MPSSLNLCILDGMPKTPTSRYAAQVIWGWIGITFLITLIRRPGRNDLEIILHACNRLTWGLPIYDMLQHNEHTKPPLGTVLFLPLTWIPRGWAYRIWDVLLLSSLALWLRAWVPRISGATPWVFSAFVLGMTLNNWNAELRGGQTNGILMMLGWIGVFAQNPWISGLALLVPILIKPHFVLLLPLVLLHSKRPFSRGGAACVFLAFLAMLYGIVFGWNRLLTDHQHWLEIGPLSIQKHILREDNFGIPAMLASIGVGDHSVAVLAIALVSSIFIAWREKNAQLAFAWVCLLLTMSSPMVWMQNFVLCTPFIGLLLCSVRTSRLAGGSLVVFFLTLQLWNPETYSLPFSQQYLVPLRPPFWGVFVGTALSVFVLARARAHRTNALE